MRDYNDDAGRKHSPQLLSRRKILAMSAGLAATQLITGVTAAAQPIELEKGKEKMGTRKLGSLEVSELGFGNMGLSGGHYGPGVDRAEGIRVIRDAQDPTRNNFPIWIIAG